MYRSVFRLGTRAYYSRPRRVKRRLASAAAGGGTRVAPTLVSYTETSWSTNTQAKTTATVSWNAGDRITVIGGTPDLSLTITLTNSAGLTMASGGAITTPASSCWENSWTCTPGSSGSGTFTSTCSASGQVHGIGVWVHRNSDGWGTRQAVSSTAKSVSLTTTQANSAVVEGVFDWGQQITGYSWVPSGQTENHAEQVVSQYTVYMANWPDRGAVGTASYGITGTSSTNNHSKIAIEVLGTAASGGLSGTLGLPTDTSTAQPIGRNKTDGLGLPTSGNVAQPIVGTKARSVGIAASGNTAQPITRNKTRAVGLPTSGSVAQPITRAKTRAVGLPTSGSTAQPITRSKTKAIGLSTGGSTAQPIVGNKARALGQASSGSTAQSITRPGAPTIVGTPQAFGFADGNTGHVCTNSDGAPAVNDYDLLFVNSDTVVSTPSGFTSAPSIVNNQGAYIFRRKAVGGEGASVTITTSGNFNCDVLWVRVRGANLADAASAVAVDANPGGTSTPAYTSAALSETGEIAFAFGAAHGHNGPGVPTSPVWSSGYTPVISGTIGGVTATAVTGFVAYKYPAGTAAESPSVSWTNGTSDRYMLFISFTAASVSGLSATIGQPSSGNTAQPITSTKTRAIGLASSGSLAQPLLRSKARAIGLATGGSTAQPLARAKSRVLGLPSTTSTSLALVQPQKVAIGQATSAGVSQPIARQKARTLGLASGAGAAFSLTGGKRLGVSIASGAATAFALGRSKSRVLGQTTGASVAQPMVGLAHLKAVGQASSGSTALALTRVKSRVLGQPASAGAARNLGTGIKVAVGQAVGGSTAQPITGRKLKAIGQAAAGSVALALTRVHSRVLGLPTSGATAQPIAARKKNLLLGQATASGQALGFQGLGTKLLGQVTSGSLALALQRAKARLLGQATSAGSSSALVGLKRASIGLTAGGSQALPMTREHRRTIGQPLSTSTAFALAHSRAAHLGLAQSSNFALQMTKLELHFERPYDIKVNVAPPTVVSDPLTFTVVSLADSVEVDLARPTISVTLD